MKKKMMLSFGIVLLIPVLIIIIHIVSMLTFDRWIQYKVVPFASQKIPHEMNGYTIAFIADTHYMSREALEAVVRELNERRIDLVLLGGDLTPDFGSPRMTVEILSQIIATDGIFGVCGNHDYYWYLYPLMEEFGITPLINSGITVREGFFLAGVEDLWRRRPDIAQAIEGAAEDDFVLLLTHNPDVTMTQDTTGADLVLAAHTHGGQITLFGLWAPALSLPVITRYGQRFRSGWAKSRDGTPVFVTNGTGHMMSGRRGLLDNVPRVFARPQVILLELKNDEREMY